MSLQAEITNLVEDGSITKELIKDGIGGTPDADQEVFFYYVMREQNGDFITGSEVQNYKAVIGQNQIHQFMEICLKSMNMGERSLFKIKSAPEIEKENIQLEIEVIKFGQLRRNNWDLNSERREKRALELKNQGNDFIKQKNFESARDCYCEGVRIIKDDFFEEIKFPLLNNLCLAYLKTSDFQKCVDTANQALEMEANNVKVIYRRASAYLQMNSFEQAEEDFKKILALDPTNPEVKKDLESLKSKKNAQKQNEKQFYGKLFK